MKKSRSDTRLAPADTGAPGAIWYIRLLGGLRIESMGGNDSAASADAAEAVDRSDGVFPPGMIVHSRPTALALLAFLALNPGVHHARAGLVYRLWPGTVDDSPSEARNKQYIRQAVSTLRQLLEPESRNATQGGAPGGRILITDRMSVCLAADAVRTDVAEFEEGLRQTGDDDGVSDLRRVQRAVDLYRASGPLLPTSGDDWVSLERHRLHSLYLNALSVVVRGLEASGQRLAAFSYALVLSQETPEDPDVAATLLRLEAASGGSALAKEEHLRLQSMLDATAPLTAKSPSRKARRGNRSGGNAVTDEVQRRILDLTPAARDLLPVLSLFGGSFTREAAAAVSGGEADAAGRSLTRLLEAGLLHREAETYRYCLLSPVRWQAAGRLKEFRRRDGNARLGRWLCALLTGINREMRRSPDRIVPHQQLMREHQWILDEGNFDAALEAHLADEADLDPRHALHRAMKILSAAGPLYKFSNSPLNEIFWYKRVLGRWREICPEKHTLGSLYLTVLVDATEAAHFHGRYKTELAWGNELLALLQHATGHWQAQHLWRRMLALAGAAHQVGENGDLARALHEKVLAIMPADLPHERAYVLQHFADVLYYQGDPIRAETMLEEALRIIKNLPVSQNTMHVQAQHGQFQMRRGNLASAERSFDAAYDAWERHIRPRLTAVDIQPVEEFMCRDYGQLYLAQGRYRHARHSFEKGLDLSRAMDRPDPEADNLRGLGLIALAQGRLSEAKAFLEQGFVNWRTKGHKHWQSVFLLTFSEIAYQEGNDSEALRLCDEADALIAVTKSHISQASELYIRARIALRCPDCESAQARALTLHRQALRLRVRFANRSSILNSLIGIASVRTAAQGAPNERVTFGVQLISAVETARRECGMPLPPVETPQFERLSKSARAILGEDRWTSAWCAGAALSVEEAVTLALEAVN